MRWKWTHTIPVSGTPAWRLTTRVRPGYIGPRIAAAPGLSYSDCKAKPSGRSPSGLPARTWLLREPPRAFLSAGMPGESWTAISPANDPELRPVVSLAFHPANPGIIYAGTTHLPWRTLDGGAHWESIHSGMIDDSDVFSIAVDAQSPATVFASACSGVYRSGDAAVPGGGWPRRPVPFVPTS